jgi:CarD family transcriptional regulator
MHENAIRACRSHVHRQESGGASVAPVKDPRAARPLLARRARQGPTRGAPAAGGTWWWELLGMRTTAAANRHVQGGAPAAGGTWWWELLGMRTTAANRHAQGGAPREWTAEVAGEVLCAGDRVMHPAHGVGRVTGIAVEEVSGFSLEFVHVAFDEADLTLRVPSGKVRGIGLRRIGLRRIASRALIDEALAVLRGRARSAKAVWSRRAQDYQAKVNSGDPRVVAEVVRDLGRNAIAGLQSYSERVIYEAALDRLAGEVAAVDGTEKAAAVAGINDLLAAAPV